MNDPRFVDARHEAEGLLDEGSRKFIVELGGVGEAGPPRMGPLRTVTRQIRQRGGEVVLAAPSRSMQGLLVEMQMEAYRDVFRGVRGAVEEFRRRGDDTKRSPRSSVDRNRRPAEMELIRPIRVESPAPFDPRGTR